MLVNCLRKRLLTEIIQNLAEFIGQSAVVADGLATIDISAITLGEPKNKSFGDLTTNAAMVLTPILKKNPMYIAEIIRQKIIENWEEAECISVAPPGFINFSIRKSYLSKELATIAKKSERYGQNKNGSGTRIQVEFVSANPTGNLHIGHGRWATLGDSLSNIFAANGLEVSREYYVNDFGSQIAKFIQCLASLYLKAFGKHMAYPEDGYPEELVKNVVEEIIREDGDSYLNARIININAATGSIQKNRTGDGPVAGSAKTGASATEIDIDAIGRRGIQIMIKRIGATLKSMGVSFDEWFYESSLYKDSNFETTVDNLKEKGIIYEKDSALWFKASIFGDEKDRVVIRTGGEPTYFASDIMYLINKIARGFDKIIYILGADHHGYIKRLHAIGRATGFDDKNIEVIIGQLVRLVEKGETVKMSKRKGRVYMLDDLIEEVGSDAVRYFFSANSFDTPMDFDLDLARQKSNKNPVYYVQYAHARIANVIEKVRDLYHRGELEFEEKMLVLPKNWEQGMPAGSAVYSRDYFNDHATLSESIKSFEEAFSLLLSDNIFDGIKLSNDDEVGLAKILIFYPDIVNDACINEAPYMINQYLYRLASQFHYFYKHHRVIDEGKLNINRFKLMLLTRVVLSNALKILGINAPEKM